MSIVSSQVSIFEVSKLVESVGSGSVLIGGHPCLSHPHPVKANSASKEKSRCFVGDVILRMICCDYEGVCVYWFGASNYLVHSTQSGFEQDLN